ncbi:MAG: DUF489 family protein [Gammaproteobacteria bacterium]|nr:DUF489 family protein [Gammaproteobacteria bacterium]
MKERTIAMAGVMQSCSQVQALARTGDWNRPVAEVCVRSVLVLDALNSAAVYGGLNGVEVGLDMLANGVFDSPAMEDVEVVQYATALLFLQQQLYRDQPRFEKFAEAIEPLSRHTGDDLYEACSRVYQQYISEMRPQIIVQGEQGHLERPDVAPKIRTLLLSGLRSAVLWQQKGGTRWRLLWERGGYAKQARRVLGAEL